jgi:UV DNA damage endonuclease
MKNLGYCCINLTLKEHNISTNRGMIKRTFQEKGLPYASELSLKNILDLKKILEWNVKHDIKIFRMSSSLFPWMSEYKFSQLPDYKAIKKALSETGKYVLDNDLRVGFHPGQYCVLPSPTARVVVNAIDDLDKHSEILDLMGLPKNHKYSLNIHVGGTYGDKESCLKRFIKGFNRLSKSTQARLVIENDDKASQYSVVDLYEGLYKHINIPITFDFFHHLFCTGGLSQEKAAELAASTWPSDIRPLAHFSSSKKLNEDASVMERSHADYLYDSIPQIGQLFDIEIEAKSKELALFNYIKEGNSMKARPTLEYKSLNTSLKLNL